MQLRRVVVTGVGAVTPIGNTAEEYWAGLLAGQNGVGLISRYDTEGHAVRIAAEVKNFNGEQHLGAKDARKIDNFTQYAMVAARQAVAMSGIELDKVDLNEFGTCVGVGMGGVYVLERQHLTMIEKGPRRVSPLFIPMMIPNMAAGLISIDLGLKGPNTCITTACASGTHAIGDAFRSVQRGDAFAMVCGGAESLITPLCITGFSNIGALSKRNDSPETASRPFDKDRDGFVMGEGAGILVLEELEHARARGANILCEMVGYGLSGDAYHMTAPSPNGEGGARAMNMCLRSGNIRPEEVDYVNAHGTSTPLNDSLETLAIKSVFGDHAKNLAISSTKSMIGHLIGAAGGVEGVATVLSIRDQKVHPTRNLATPDPECDLDYVPGTSRELPIRVAISNSLGFGGHNCTIAFRRYEG